MEVSFRHLPIVRRIHVLAVGRLAHQPHQLVVKFPKRFSPHPADAARPTFSGLISGQSSYLMIHLNEEDAWILSRGLLLVRATR